MRDGLLGLLLYLANWLSPGTGDVRIDVGFVKKLDDSAIVFQCHLNDLLNRQLEQLIDAGIPLRFKFVNVVNQNDTLSFVRSLQFNMVEFTYSWTDSTKDVVTHSSNYSLIHLAMVDFCKWKITVPADAQHCYIEVQILPSRAERLDRVVDMRRVWGQQNVVLSFNPGEKINQRNNR